MPEHSDTRFHDRYEEGTPAWDIGRPQKEYVRLEREGGFRGRVLDAGCGTGENALYLAGKGYDVLGIDFVPGAIERAKRKAEKRGIRVRFTVHDALNLAALGQRFDTAFCSGLFHVFEDEKRPLFEAGLYEVLKDGGRYYLLCFSEHEPPGYGPRRVTQNEIRDTFSDRWEVEWIREAVMENNLEKGHAEAWLASIRRI